MSVSTDDSCCDQVACAVCVLCHMCGCSAPPIAARAGSPLRRCRTDAPTAAAMACRASPDWRTVRCCSCSRGTGTGAHPQVTSVSGPTWLDWEFPAFGGLGQPNRRMSSQRGVRFLHNRTEACKHFSVQARRSTDEGATWSEGGVIFSPPHGAKGANAGAPQVLGLARSVGLSAPGFCLWSWTCKSLFVPSRLSSSDVLAEILHLRHVCSCCQGSHVSWHRCLLATSASPLLLPPPALPTPGAFSSAS
jgi:hypothetical protein